MMGLTAKQRELYNFIATRLARDGVAPTFDEMAKALGHASKGHVAQFLAILEERGYIRRLPHKARAIELISQGDAVELRPEVRSAAVEYAQRTHTTLSAVISEAVAAYLGKAA